MADLYSQLMALQKPFAEAAKSGDSATQKAIAVQAQVIKNTADSIQMSAQDKTAFAVAVASGIPPTSAITSVEQLAGLSKADAADADEALMTRKMQGAANIAQMNLSEIKGMLAQLIDSQQVQDKKLSSMENVMVSKQISTSGSPLWTPPDRPSFNVPNFLVQATSDKDVEGIAMLISDLGDIAKVIEGQTNSWTDMSGYEFAEGDERTNELIKRKLMQNEENGNYKPFGGLKRLLLLMQDPAKAEAARHRLSMSASIWQKVMNKLIACGVSALLMGVTGNFPVAAMGYFAADGLLDGQSQKLMYNGTLVDNFSVGGYSLKPIGLQIPGLPNEIFFEYRYCCFDQLSGKIYPSDEIRPLNYQGGTFRWVCIDRMDGSMYHANFIKKPRIYLD